MPTLSSFDVRGIIDVMAEAEHELDAANRENRQSPHASRRAVVSGRLKAWREAVQQKAVQPVAIEPQPALAAE